MFHGIGQRGGKRLRAERSPTGSGLTLDMAISRPASARASREMRVSAMPTTLTERLADGHSKQPCVVPRRRRPADAGRTGALGHARDRYHVRLAEHLRERLAAVTEATPAAGGRIKHRSGRPASDAEIEVVDAIDSGDVEALREELGVHAEKKGDMVGPMTIVDNGYDIDLSRMGSGGWGVPGRSAGRYTTALRLRASSWPRLS